MAWLSKRGSGSVRLTFTIKEHGMKKFLVVPVAALFLAACSESTAPTAVANSPNFAPRADFVAAGLGDSFDFEGGFSAAASPFAPNRVDDIPSDTYSRGGKGFLGKFTNDAVTIGTSYVGNGWLNFDLYIEGTWDGNAKGKYGPDVLAISAYCGSTITGTPAATFVTSFSNKATTKQSFPGSYPAASYAGLTGATHLDELGFSAAGEVLTTNHAVSTYDAVYSLSFAYPAACATAGAVTFVLSSNTLQSPTDEFWGIDNVSVTASAANTAHSWQ